MYPFSFLGSGIDAQAQAHYNRVIADGGLIPSGLDGVNTFFNTIKTIYGTSDINTAISVGLDPQVLGYKLGAGSGTTLGQAAQKLYSPKDVFGGIGTGSAFWEGSGVAGNFVSTPNAAANQITGDIEIIGKKIKLLDYTNTYAIASKGDTASNRGWVLRSNAGTLAFLVSYNGTSSESITATTDLTSAGYVLGTEYYFKVTRVSSTGSVSFYGSSDGVTYTQIGSSVIGTTGASFNSTGLVYVGNWGNALNNFAGKIGGVTISNTIGGTPAVDFNPNQYTGANTWTSTTSEVWTVNRTGAGLADVVQTTAASQPLLLVHSGANYLWSSGVTGNNCTTSTNSNFQVSGNWTIEFNISDLTVNGEYISQGNTTNGFVVFLNAGAVRYSYFASGVRTVDLTSQPINLITQKWCRIQRNGVNYAWFTSTDGITFTQVGSNQVDIVSTPNITAPLRVGQGVNFFASPCVAKTYRARFYNDATQTTLISDFNPNQYNAATSQTQWTSSTGEVWTINTGTAATGYKGVLVDRMIMQGDGVDDLLINAIVRPNILTQYLATNTYTNDNSGNAVLVDSNSGSYLNSIVAFTSIVGNIMNGFASDLTKAKSANVVYLVTTSNNSGVKNAISVNNGTETTNAYTPALSGNGISILSRSSGGTKANALINTYLLSNAQDDSTVRTDMYNYIRSINNSAF